MTQEQIYAVVTDVMRKVFDDNAIVATPSMSAKDVAEWDSFNHINIVVATEIRLGIKFRASEIDGLKNVGEFVNLICQKLAA